MTQTTIKVPMRLRERIRVQAKARGVTSAALIQDALDELERQQRWKAVGSAFDATSADDDYWDEFRAWDAIQAGLPDD